MIRSSAFFIIFSALIFNVNNVNAEVPLSHLHITCIPDANYMHVAGFYVYADDTESSFFNEEKNPNIKLSNIGRISCKFADGKDITLFFNHVGGYYGVHPNYRVSVNIGDEVPQINNYDYNTLYLNADAGYNTVKLDNPDYPPELLANPIPSFSPDDLDTVTVFGNKLHYCAPSWGNKCYYYTMTNKQHSSKP